jgi:dimethylargininase
MTDGILTPRSHRERHCDKGNVAVKILTEMKEQQETEMERRPTSALVRGLAQTYAELYRKAGINVSTELAEQQHARYAAALQRAGLSVGRVPADDAYPDCVFIEDTAIVKGERALLGRLTPHREGEGRGVERVLRQRHETLSLPAEALLEGGDVMHIGATTYAGLTGRTNEAGIRALREFLRPSGQRVVAVPVKDALHLKTVATYLGNDTLIAAQGFLDTSLFEVEEIIFTARDEAGAANCLRIADHLLISEGKPQTTRRLRAFADSHSVKLVPLDISEFEKGSGSLTCLSLIW